MTYSHRSIEKKWINIWAKNKIFATDLHDFSRPKLYLLDMFPYPSGAGLHVGHIRGYLATDVLTRMKKMQGYNVLHPIGFDSFGLPTEQYAIKTGNDPAPFTQKNIQNFLHQLEMLGFAYDYQKLIYTSDPKYYQWTQWSFLQMYHHKLAKIAHKNVNYCPQLNTVLANEEIINENGQMVSERGGFPVVRRQQKQWVISLNKFADDLLSGLKNLDWPTAVKKQQTDWIGRTDGYQLSLPAQENSAVKFPSFYSDPFVWQNATFFAVSFTNDSYDKYLSPAVQAQRQQLSETLARKAVTDARLVNEKPIGLNTNWSIKNPLTGTALPVYFVEYVDADFAFGTSIGNPLFEAKDWYFARTHSVANLPAKPLTIQRQQATKQWQKAQSTTTALALQQPANTVTFFKIKDWIFSRQRYWGEPFPLKIVNDKVVPLAEDKLPLQLPAFTDDLWAAGKNAQLANPLARVPEWVAQNYDTNTMPQWAGSCWYFLAFVLFNQGNYLPLNSPSAKKLLDHWLPVDLYIGGQEHAVSHLIYSRFWHRFLHQIGITSVAEPFQKLRNQGMILSSENKKMSKSKGNVVNPLDFVVSHGFDAIRLHEKFLGPFAAKIQWDENNLDAMRKWLARVYTIFTRTNFWTKANFNAAELARRDRLVKEVTTNFDSLFFNVAIAKLMGFINYCYKQETMPAQFGLDFLRLLHPICPAITDELAQVTFSLKTSLSNSSWPKYSEKNLQTNQITLVLQVNGKFKKTIVIEKNLPEKTVLFLAKNALSDWLIGRIITKFIYVPNKAINFLIQ